MGQRQSSLLKIVGVCLGGECIDVDGCVRSKTGSCVAVAFINRSHFESSTRSLSILLTTNYNFTHSNHPDLTINGLAVDPYDKR